MCGVLDVVAKKVLWHAATRGGGGDGSSECVMLLEYRTNTNRARADEDDEDDGAVAGYANNGIST